jgi:hypothetical protein
MQEVGELMGNHRAVSHDTWSYEVAEREWWEGGPTIEVVFKDGRVLEVRKGYEKPQPPRPRYVPY